MAKKEAISKTEAVRRVLKAGVEEPAKAVPYLKEKFGIDMNNATFSTYKSQVKAAMEKKKGQKAGRGDVGGNAAPRTGRGGPDGVGIEAVNAVAAVVNQYGADKVKKIVALIG